MRSVFSKPEFLLLGLCAGLLALAVFGPQLLQPAQHHDFADQRALWGVPCAMDVLSNLPFALAALLGAACLWRLPAGAISNVQRGMAALFFTGLLLTALASSWYHLHPDDAGLAIDRCGMAVAFAGLLGLAAAGHVSERAGAVLGLAVLVLGPWAVHVWSATGNLLPWAVVQFGGITLIVWLALLRSSRCRAAPNRLRPLGGQGAARGGSSSYRALNIRWSLVILAYAAAKLLEANDHAIYEFTGQWLSGHTLKHAVAALAAWPVIAAIGAMRKSGQNGFVSKTKAIAGRGVGRHQASEERSFQ